MGLAMIRPVHPRMLLWGSFRRCKARWMWHLKMRKFVKFGHGAMEGGFTTGVTTSLGVIIVSMLAWDRT